MEYQNEQFIVDRGRVELKREGSVVVEEEGGVHEPNRWHPAYSLPLVAYYVVSLDCIERDVVKSSQYVYLLGLRYGDC